MTKRWLPWALLLQLLANTFVVSGKILDREGKPLVNAQVIYTNTATGKIYKIITDSKGEFSTTGMTTGFYHIEIIGADGQREYTGQRSIGTQTNQRPGGTMEVTDPNWHDLKTNFLSVDLSAMGPGGVMPSPEQYAKMSKEQLAALRRENASVIATNRLVPELQIALGSGNWPRATEILQRLIASDPNRWEFYQNLATIQNNTGQYENAVATYEKSIATAEKTFGKTPSLDARESLSQMLIAQADCYNHLGRLSEAVVGYAKAADIAPKPALAHFYACNAERNNGKMEAAIEQCDRALAADPKQWEFYQTKAGAQADLGQNDDAMKTYEQGIQVARADIQADRQTVKSKAGLGQMLSSEANIYVQDGKYEEAIPLYSQAAEVAAYPAQPYFNLCAMYYDIKDLDGALAACGKAIASDPNMADAYFVTGSILFGRGAMQKGKYQWPDGASEALKKYLEIKPDGAHAADVKAMLETVGAKVDTTYKPKQ